jgi:hypothetical protein
MSQLRTETRLGLSDRVGSDVVEGKTQGSHSIKRIDQSRMKWNVSGGC